MAQAPKLRRETRMAEAVARRLPRSVREVRVGDCIFDVVAYDKRDRLFRLVECKLGSQATSIGHAFGQLAAYYAILSARGRDFLDVFSKKVPLRYGRLMEATEENRRIRVAFYVALTDRACKRVDLLRSLKRLLPQVGIIRVKDDGKCRDYLREHGERNHKLAEATPVAVEILRSRPIPKTGEV